MELNSFPLKNVDFDVDNNQKKDSYNRYFPLGANSPGHMFSEVKTSRFTAWKGTGSSIFDKEGKEYVDLMMGLGPCLLGHTPETVVHAVKTQIENGSVFSTNSIQELELASKIVDANSHFMDSLRFTCSGTEAVMGALRVARAFTGKNAILKFRGSYHGHSDATLAIPSHEIKNTIHSGLEAFCYEVDFNDVEALKELISEKANELSAIIVEPIACNMGLVQPTNDFLRTLRELCDQNRIVLIFDEVVNGFRFCYGSVSKIFEVKPDLAVFGKIIGGGLAIGAYGGRAEIMKVVEQYKGAFPGGTFAGSALTMAAGLATLNELESGKLYEKLAALCGRFSSIVREGFKSNGLPYSVDNIGSIASFVLIPSLEKLNSKVDVDRQNTQLFSEFHYEMMQHGILFPPTLEEPIYFSAPLEFKQIEDIAHLCVAVFKKISVSKDV